MPNAIAILFLFTFTLISARPLFDGEKVKRQIYESVVGIAEQSWSVSHFTIVKIVRTYLDELIIFTILSRQFFFSRTTWGARSRISKPTPNGVLMWNVLMNFWHAWDTHAITLSASSLRSTKISKRKNVPCPPACPKSISQKVDSI